MLCFLEGFFVIMRGVLYLQQKHQEIEIMVAVTFDTLKYVETLRTAGVPEIQAKAMAEAQREVFAEVSDNSLATKSDIFGVKQEIAEVRHEVVEVKSDIKLLKWMFGFLLAGVASLVVKAFFG
jgi:hypothetical protein